MRLGMKFVIYKRVSTSDPHDRESDLEKQEWEIQSYLDTHAPEDYQVIDGFTDLHDTYRPEIKKAIIRAQQSGATLLVARADCLDVTDSFLARQLSAGNLMVKIAQRPNVVVRPRLTARAGMQHGQDAPHPALSDVQDDRSHRPKSGTSIPLKNTEQSTAETAPSGIGAPDIWSLIDVYRKKTSATQTSERATPISPNESVDEHSPCLKAGNSNTVQLKPEEAAIGPVHSRTDAVKFSVGHWMDQAASFPPIT